MRKQTIKRKPEALPDTLADRLAEVQRTVQSMLPSLETLEAVDDLQRSGKRIVVPNNLTIASARRLLALLGVQ